MIPHEIEHQHVAQAAERIDKEGVPNRRKSYRYDLMLGGRPYPPKYVISLATEFATGSEYPAKSFDAVEAKNYFVTRGYDVADRDRADSRVAPEEDESAFAEGASVYARHKRLERDGAITRQAKAKRLREAGRLECDVCAFDFRAAYGPRGDGFIEAHHTIPVAELGGVAKTKLGDIALVCSNCHRMLHRGTPLAVEELRAMLEEDGSSRSK